MSTDNLHNTYACIAAMGTVSGQGTASRQDVVNAAGGSSDRIVMGTPNTQLPSTSLFNVQPDGGHALVESDPPFTNYRCIKRSCCACA
ncbi:hypothetical protein [Xanthomonas sp. GPE 39]|uniref:hypothetical protein n=1 Tax=Xanthomonas sp. GPE 39 TaxID=1583099 RepID=UPI0005F2E07F|nr:hypothetical protein [Xanthomonas sp. GPE 39]